MIGKDILLIIRKMKFDELENLQKFLLSMSLPAEGIKDNMNHFFILDEAGKIVGSIGMEVFGTRALLRSLAVIPEHRNKGWGKKLVDQILEYSVHQHIKEAYLLTETAADYMTGWGFEVVGRDEVHEGVKDSIEFKSCCPQSAICMRKYLK